MLPERAWLGQRQAARTAADRVTPPGAAVVPFAGNRSIIMRHDEPRKVLALMTRASGILAAVSAVVLACGAPAHAQGARSHGEIISGGVSDGTQLKVALWCRRAGRRSGSRS
jgi:hypothetical protein